MSSLDSQSLSASSSSHRPHRVRSGIPGSALVVVLMGLIVVAYFQLNAPAANDVDPGTGSELPRLPLLAPVERGLLLKQIANQLRTFGDIQKYALDFTHLTDTVRQSTDMADYLLLVFEVTQKRGLLDAKLARELGRLFAGDSFDPNGNGFGKNSRGDFEKCRSLATPEQKQNLEAGIRECFEEQMSRAPVGSARDAVRKLVGAMTDWGDERYAQTADCFFGPQYASSWNLAVKHLGVLFLLKAREVSPEANALSQSMVASWLKDLADGKSLTPLRPNRTSDEDKAILTNVLVEIGQPDILQKLSERAALPENRHTNGVINSPPIIYANQYRNLILKEIRRGFPLNEIQRTRLEAELTNNEAELTDMLRQFQTEEGTTDGLSGYNTFAVATTVLTSQDPSIALKAMLDISDQEYAPYYVDSKFKATPRAGAGRTVPFRLAELTHLSTSKEVDFLREKLAKAVVNYMDYLPDLMYHARGRYWHRGDDQIAPYFFHPTVPYEAASLRMLSHDPSLTDMERAHFRYLQHRLRRDLIASQKADGTFMLPDTVGDLTVKKEENGGYYSSAAWVNPLAGLALLCLIDDAQELHTQYGILNPESFQKK